MKAQEKELLLDWYRLAYCARQIDERAARYIRRGMGWSYHARCGGHEGIQIALGQSFRPNKDYLFPYYRDTATVLAAGMTPLEMMLNGLSRAADPGSGGRHMSNHFSKPSIHIQNVSSCTGNQTLHAAGLARAVKYYQSDAIVFCSQGESSASEGYCFEAYNGASREKLPVVFVIQNNLYGISVPWYEQTANKIVADNFSGLKNILIVRTDGLDFFASHKAMQEAISYVKTGAGPALVHALCVRLGAHSNSDSQELYRDPKELAELSKKDPLALLKKSLLQKKIGEGELKSIEKAVDSELDKAAEAAEAAPQPLPSSIYDFAYAPVYDPPKDSALATPVEPNVQEKLREAINRTLIEEFELNENTFLWGQDVASHKKGGVFNVTKGMLEKFKGARIFNSPIAEDFIVGTANGMSRYRKDIRIVIEAAQFADYIWPAMEQIVEMGHEYWRTLGQFSPNVVLRLPSGGYITGGLYHSQNVEAIMSHLPGIRVVYPSYADDAAGLLRTAIRSFGPTFFLEPKYLYNRPDAAGPRYGKEYAIPFGKGKIRKEGQDLSVITYGNTVHMVLKVAEKLSAQGHDVEVFDLRSIKPMDVSGICATVQKTGKALVVHEDSIFNGLAGEIISQIMEHCFSYLDAPVMRVCGKDLPIGFAKPLEEEILPSLSSIENAMLNVLEF